MSYTHTNKFSSGLPLSFRCAAPIPNKEHATIRPEQKKWAQTYTQTKKKRPIFMVLYFLIQLRCRNKKISQNVFQTSDTQKLVIIWFLLLILKGYWTLCAHSFLHQQQEVNHQNVIHFTLNGSQKRPTMKKHLKIPRLLIERLKLQFKTFDLRN